MPQKSKKKCPKCSCGRKLSEEEIKTIEDRFPFDSLTREEFDAILAKIDKKTGVSKEIERRQKYQKKTKKANFGQY